jgi:dipeptidase
MKRAFLGIKSRVKRISFGGVVYTRGSGISPAPSQRHHMSSLESSIIGLVGRQEDWHPRAGYTLPAPYAGIHPIPTNSNYNLFTYHLRNLKPPYPLQVASSSQKQHLPPTFYTFISSFPFLYVPSSQTFSRSTLYWTSRLIQASESETTKRATKVGKST